MFYNNNVISKELHTSAHILANYRREKQDEKSRCNYFNNPAVDMYIKERNKTPTTWTTRTPETMFNTMWLIFKIISSYQELTIPTNEIIISKKNSVKVSNLIQWNQIPKTIIESNKIPKAQVIK